MGGLRRVGGVGRVHEMVVRSLGFGFGFIFGVLIRLVLSVHPGYDFMNITKRLGIIFI